MGLHSGAPVTMRLLPAPAGSGIVFRRTDLDNFEIPATGRNVAKVSYATSLMRQGVLISTTEHLLSALIGMGVDNVIVELDNLELPILDGSALPYVEAFQSAGIRVQRRRRETIRVLRPVEVREGDKFIGVYPGSGYRISYTIDFPAPIGQQKTCVDLAAETYGELRLRRRGPLATRPTSSELRDMGLIRGASPENAIILGANGPGEWAAAVCRRICAAQGAGPDWRPGAGGTADRGTRGGGARRTRDAHGARVAAAERPLSVGAGACAGGGAGGCGGRAGSEWRHGRGGAGEGVGRVRTQLNPVEELTPLRDSRLSSSPLAGHVSRHGAAVAAVPRRNAAEFPRRSA